MEQRLPVSVQRTSRRRVGTEGLGAMNNNSLAQLFVKFSTKLRRNHCDTSARPQQQSDLARSHFPAANHQAVAVFYVDKNWQKIHLSCLHRGG